MITKLHEMYDKWNNIDKDSIDPNLVDFMDDVMNTVKILRSMVSDLEDRIEKIEESF